MRLLCSAQLQILLFKETRLQNDLSLTKSHADTITANN